MFVPLETKTVYTFMESLIDIDTYISRGKELGYRSLGIMDRDHLYSAYHFIKKAKENGLQPLVGLSTALMYGGSMIECRFLALNSRGYRNLMKLSTEVMSANRDLESLVPFLDQVLCIIPYDEQLEKITLPIDYHIGVYPDSPQKDYDKPIIPLYPVNSFEDSEKETLQVLTAIKDNVSLSDVLPDKGSTALKDSQSLTSLFQERFPESLSNLEEIISDITYHFDKHLKLPRFNRDKEAVVELRERTYQGLRDKGIDSPIYRERLEKELAIIHDMGFDDYFLIVWDLLTFGRQRGYYMGMGRGSAAGSLVAYALSITGIDPIKNHLLFERFLNAERYSMPDIDIDLPDIYRSDFLRYVRDRYGSDHAAQIVTFSTFGAKQAIRDVFKRFGASEHELSAITKKISFRDHLTSVYDKNLAFRQIITSKPEFQRAFAIAKRIEGNPRQTSIHAAGVVMSDDLLTDHIPLKTGDEMMITQYDAGAVEANGLLKMDFLGLRNLTFVQKMKEALSKELGQDFVIESIDLEDPKTLALFAAGRTKGIFQFEQAGAISLLKRIKPETFEEVVATTSLNRPGASDYIDNFIARKYGKEKVDLIDPIVAPILEPTYGIMLYQEQVMQIAQVFAGFTLGKADLLRRAMSKKNAADMQLMASDFLQGAEKLGRDPETAERLFGMMAKFAGYGFNRSHAFAYSALAFQLAYFKAHYPAIFFDVMLNHSSGDYLSDALESGFTLAKLTINQIPYTDKLSQGHIYLGLKNIKGLPRDMAFWIIENRPFSGIEDFLTRLPQHFQKTDLLLPLIQIGLFDNFESNRHKVEANLDRLMLFVQELGSLFAESSYNWQEASDYSDAEKYQQEMAILGIGLSPHPLKELMAHSSRSFTQIEQLVPNDHVTLLAQVTGIRVIRTKTGQQMAFLKITDTHHSLDVTVFPETYQNLAHQIKEEAIYYLMGKTQERAGRIQLILNELEQATTEKYWIQLQNHDHDKLVARILKQYPGNIPVVLHYQDSHETLQSQTYFVSKTSELDEMLRDYVMKTVFR
ncbi:DNA polymerase III subunit alpha [Streptococcus acidominimus]|uniref:DNA polymerase III subunit alpha n=1 Tax=Streptococcus acidominimus TaxID=1326 RepID=A0A239X3E3_STRAI|nr:DNA polymerase III subunit alpha [Streptococcus acidominimus]SNV41217.1 DNA polymerase III subunit alpha [Streptococcus acidominimus]